MKQRDNESSLQEELKEWLVHGQKHPSHKWRNLSLAAALITLFCILLFARLSAVQAYAISIAFVSLAGYAIALGFRD